MSPSERTLSAGCAAAGMDEVESGICEYGGSEM